MAKNKAVAAEQVAEQNYDERSVDYLASRIAIARAACDKAGGFGLNTGSAIAGLVLALEVSDLYHAIAELKQPAGACACACE